MPADPGERDCDGECSPAELPEDQGIMPEGKNRSANQTDPGEDHELRHIRDKEPPPPEFIPKGGQAGDDAPGRLFGIWWSAKTMATVSL